MSYLDDLLTRIADPALREALQNEFTGLTKQKKFGLIFEHHDPESVALHNTRVRKNGTVAFKSLRTANKGNRQERDDRLFRVIEILTDNSSGRDVKTARLVQIAGPDLVTPETAPLDDLVAIAQFGTPVYPGLKHTGSAVHANSTAAADKPSHVVIKGENFHALQALTFTHENSVDCIYIDPPYNTGGDFTYNDKRVSKEDSFRHSKWLSFMHRRLELAKRLLKDTGVIIVAIDDNEHAHLKLLMDQVFGEDNFLNNIVWQGGYDARSRFASNGHDYMVVYGKSKNALANTGVKWTEPKPGMDEMVDECANAWEVSEHDEVEATRLFRSWLKPRKAMYAAGLAAYDRIDSNGVLYRGVSLGCPAAGTPYWYEVTHPITGLVCKTSSAGWRHSPARFERNVLSGRILFGKDETTVPQQKYLITDSDMEVPKTVFDSNRTGATTGLERLLGDKRFSFPKDIQVLIRWIGLVTNQNPNAVILDFFGGSGSTLQAVMEMNAADGGQRQCILVTNNEVETKQATVLTKAGHVPGDDEWESWGVLERVTRPRVSTVVTGIRDHLDGSTYSAGLPDERVEFFDLTHEDPGAIRLARAYKSIEPLLWLRAGAIGAYEFTNGGASNSVVIASPYAVLHDVNYSADFIQQVNADPTITHPFVVSESSATFQAIVRSLNEDRRDNAMRLYKGYTKTFETNTNQENS